MQSDTVERIDAIAGFKKPRMEVHADWSSPQRITTLHMQHVLVIHHDSCYVRLNHECHNQVWQEADGSGAGSVTSRCYLYDFDGICSNAF